MLSRSGVTVHSRFPEIAAGLDNKVSTALKIGAEQIAQEAKQRVPVRNGTLRDAIHVESAGDDGWDVVAGDNVAFYGHMVEFGTIFAAARPFLIPAMEARKAEIEKAVSAALDRL